MCKQVDRISIEVNRYVSFLQACSTSQLNNKKKWITFRQRYRISRSFFYSQLLEISPKKIRQFWARLQLSRPQWACRVQY